MSSYNSFGAAAPAAQPNYETVSLVCAAYMNHLFGSARYPYPCPRSAWQPHLPSYIKTALISSQLDVSVVYHAMTLLGQYKVALPESVAYYDDAYRLFMSAYIVAAKVSCDTPHELRFWRLVGRGKFTSEELVKMELEFCRVLKWDVQIQATAFTSFKGIVESYEGVTFVRGSAGVIQVPRFPQFDEPPPRYEYSWRDVRMLVLQSEDDELPPVVSLSGMESRSSRSRVERAAPPPTSDAVRTKPSLWRRVLSAILIRPRSA
ncbi:unnamed protein product [Cyclocybe aegerita]|uniref:Cyclin N-terminal domain-containing protein n=1 Tax=Cyclocybe aegerita TaxID=1973307 RepID=A0A8S0XKH5_CYCAE|nr:unnamed protein product [Cyclocybe aegerita]